MAALSQTEQPKLAQHPPAPFGGANIVCLDPSGFEFFGIPSDNHRWLGDLKNEWEKHFHPADDVLLGAPYSVYEVKDELRFMGETYNADQQIECIVHHMLSKKWAPKHFFPTVADAHKAVTHKEYNLEAGLPMVAGVPTKYPEKKKQFHGMLKAFTKNVEDMHVINHICGAREGNEDIISCAIREAKEELGVVLTPDQLTYVGHSEVHKSRKTGLDSCTAIFSVKFDKDELLAIYDQAMQEKSVISNWQCIHAWYKFLPGIDVKAAKALKANYETIPGAKWYPLNIQDTMDYKTKVLTMRFIDLTSPVVTPEPKMQRLPCWSDDEGAGAKRAAPTLTSASPKKPKSTPLMPIIVLAEPHPDSLRRLQSFR